jgi:predicted phosphodiesterase
MRIALLSDIHANSNALESVFSDIDDNKRKVDQYFCLGDIIGYGPDPVKVIELLAKRVAPLNVISGNHEDLYRGLDEYSFNVSAKLTMLYEISLINSNPQAIEYLKQISNSESGLVFRKVKNNNFFLSHNGPGKHYDVYHYPWMAESLLPNLMNRFKDQCHINSNKKKWFLSSKTKNVFLTGHTHIPMICFEDRLTGKVKSLDTDGIIDIKRDCKDSNYIMINPGSVGYSRDGSSLASYVIIDLKKKAIEFHRTRYNIEIHIEKVASMEKWLADNLPPGYGFGDVDQALASLVQSLGNASIPVKAPENWKINC